MGIGKLAFTKTMLRACSAFADLDVFVVDAYDVDVFLF